MRKPLTKADLEYRLTTRDRKIERLEQELETRLSDIEQVAASRDKTRDRERNALEKISRLQETIQIQAGALDRQKDCFKKLYELQSVEWENRELREREEKLLLRLTACQAASDPALKFPATEEEFAAWWARQQAVTDLDTTMPSVVPDMTPAISMNIPDVQFSWTFEDMIQDDTRKRMLSSLYRDAVREEYKTVTEAPDVVTPPVTGTVSVTESRMGMGDTHYQKWMADLNRYERTTDRKLS